MTKSEFLEALKNALSGLPQEDIDERTDFYSEMIDDKIEEGILETQAVASIGEVEAIVSQIVAEVPISKLVKQKIKRENKLKTWEIVLLAVGSPIWASLLIAFLAVVLSLYISLWAVIISLWSVFVSFVASGFSGLVSGTVFCFTGNRFSGLFIIGAALVALGLGVFCFFGCTGRKNENILYPGTLKYPSEYPFALYISFLTFQFIKIITIPITEKRCEPVIFVRNLICLPR